MTPKKSFLARHQTTLVMLLVIIWLASTKSQVDEEKRLDAFKAGYSSGRFSMVTSPYDATEREQLRALCQKEWPHDPTTEAAKARACNTFGG